MRHHLLLTSYFLLLTSAHALTDAWSVNVRQPQSVQRTYMQGESWTMQVSLRDGLKAMPLTNATARFYWYTNSTDNLWWTNSATITVPLSGTVQAEWTPAMDTGAAYNYFWIGIWTSGATSPLWRVSGSIRLLASPGFTPNALPLPVRTLDFSALSLTNAPWATTNTLAGALQSEASTNALFAAWFGSLFNSTSRWESAFGWGDWHSAVALKLDAADTNGWETGSHAAFLMGEADLAALRLYHYGSPDIIESPAELFNISPATGTITSFNNNDFTGPRAVVVPFQIGGIEVKAIGNYVFHSLNTGDEALLSIVFPRGISYLGDEAFMNCSDLTNFVFSGNAPAVGSNTFYNFKPSIVATVINPLATGWGKTLSDTGTESYEQRSIPVVRLPLHTDALTLDGVTRTEWPDVSGFVTTQSLTSVSNTAEQAASDALLAQGDINNHTANGVIHVTSGDKAAWNAATNAPSLPSGIVTNNAPVVRFGVLELSNTQPTNLVLRLVCSNEHIIVQEVYP